MPPSLIYAVPLALTWALVTGNFSLDSLLVGLVIGAVIMLLTHTDSTVITWRRVPDQLAALVVYVVTLVRDIWLSTWDVTKRVLNPRLPLNPGILAVETQDDTENDVIAAFSAHGITITPGELVVDFDGGHTMFVHCLDVDASAQTAPGAQTKRLRLLRRVTGVSLSVLPREPVPSISPPEAAS